MVLAAKQCFGVWGIIWASDPKGQELGGGAAGGQEVLQDVKF